MLKSLYERNRRIAMWYGNLLVAEDNTNQSKGDKGPAEWKPPLKSYWKTYAAKWRAVKKKYKLTLSVAEERASKVMERDR